MDHTDSQFAPAHARLSPGEPKVIRPVPRSGRPLGHRYRSPNAQGKAPEVTVPLLVLARLSHLELQRIRISHSKGTGRPHRTNLVRFELVWPPHGARYEPYSDNLRYLAEYYATFRVPIVRSFCYNRIRGIRIAPVIRQESTRRTCGNRIGRRFNRRDGKVGPPLSLATDR